MRLIKGRVQNYRAVRDSGWFDIEDGKTILVGANEAGKTAILQALQQINKPDGIRSLEPLRDYPRSSYNDITTGKVDPSKEPVATVQFALDEDDLASFPSGCEGAIYEFTRRLDNSAGHSLKGGPDPVYWNDDLQKQFARMAAHLDKRQDAELVLPSVELAAITQEWRVYRTLTTPDGAELGGWLAKHVAIVDEENSTENNRHTKLTALARSTGDAAQALKMAHALLPVFVLFNNYFRVKPSIHLRHLAERIDSGILDDDQFDYGNQCLLSLLGFTARELSQLGEAPDPGSTDADGLKAYRDQLDKRSYQLNAASVQLTDEIRRVWNPQEGRDEANRLRVQADGQYLKVVVEDSLGVEVELDQRSEGFQWLVSFFVVFFAEASGKHANAVLLLDEPGLSLHGLKQREFRSTLTRLAETNQTLYTTHSPFLVGPDELDIVRVVEMTDRRQGTSVHTTVSAADPASLLPLQEALGYDLAQSLFTQQRNLVLEGLTDYWYLDATAELLRASSDGPNLNQKIALVSADSAGKVVYYATILHANSLKVAALLDSDSAGDTAAKQENLVHRLGNKNILRTKDAYVGQVNRPEVEDLLRETLIHVAKTEFGTDVTQTAAAQPGRPIVDLFDKEISNFSKYKLAKAYVRWTRDNDASALTTDEVEAWTKVVNKINSALK